MLFLYLYCNQRKNNVLGEFNPQNIEKQIFKIKNKRDTSFITKGGTTLKICSNTFETDASEIEIQVQEILTKEDIIKSGIPTMADNGELLESAGMIHVVTNPQVPINKLCPIKTIFPPSSILNPRMKLFKADIDNGKMTWTFENEIMKDFVNDFEKGKKLFESNCKNCHGVAETLTGPALQCSESYHTRKWLVKFTKNAQKMIASRDKQAICTWNRYKPTIMPIFEKLDDKEINLIYDYIKNSKEDCDCNTGSCKEYYENCGNQDILYIANANANKVGYEFSITDYNWRNIDAFLDESNTTQAEPFIVTTDVTEPLEMCLIFARKKIVIPLIKYKTDYEMFKANLYDKDKINLPLGSEVIIFAFGKEKNGQRLYGEMSVQCEEKNHHKLTLNSITKEEFLKIVKEKGITFSCCRTYGRSS